MPYERNYKKEYENYHKKKEQKENRVLRNSARRQAERAGKVCKGDGKDIDHKNPLIKNGTNSKSNLRVVPASKNRSFPRDKKARMK